MREPDAQRPPVVAAQPPAVELVDASLAYGARTLWAGLTLSVERGEFVAVLGPNGSGKTSLLKVLLGLVPVSTGTVAVAGSPVHRGNPRVGYIPQHRGLNAQIPLRARDLVRLGIDGHRWGPAWPSRSRNRLVDELLDQVGASSYANVPVSRLSGGEQQRLRVAHALATDPAVLLCDEPLLSLDLRHQRSVVELIRRRQRDHGTAVVFVTHEINPILSVTDRVLYITHGAFRLGSVDEVMTSEVLSELYSAEVEVIRRGRQLIVVGADDDHSHHVADDLEGEAVS
ncbi:MAG: zinc/manganese transport system ATP-binding protein [Pseudonocardiales bacterium]|nr:zinc/manganese transport system ATP-binding protein [Pseudonocardiales bacterium]